MTAHSIGILKRVVRREFLTNKYCRPGEGCIRHHLECGHSICAKQSAGTPTQKRCLTCGQLHRDQQGKDKT